MTIDEPVWGAPATPEALGELLAVLRRRRGLTQAEVAEQAGAPRRFVNELEGGHATLYLRRLFDVLDVLDARLVVAEPDAVKPGATGKPGPTGGSTDATAGTGQADAGLGVHVTGVSSPDGPRLKDLGW